jgi:hypothetical protein
LTGSPRSSSAKARGRAAKLKLAAWNPSSSAAVWIAEELHASPRAVLRDARDTLSPSAFLAVLHCFLRLAQISTIASPFLDAAEDPDLVPTATLRKLVADETAEWVADVKALLATRAPARASKSSRRRR